MSAPTATANDPQSGMDEILRTRQLISASRLIARSTSLCKICASGQLIPIALVTSFATVGG